MGCSRPEMESQRLETWGQGWKMTKFFYVVLKDIILFSAAAPSSIYCIPFRKRQPTTNALNVSFLYLRSTRPNHGRGRKQHWWRWQAVLFCAVSTLFRPCGLLIFKLLFSMCHFSSILVKRPPAFLHLVANMLTLINCQSSHCRSQCILIYRHDKCNSITQPT